MKELLAVISLVLSGAVAEAPAPYPPSGFRPNGPAFELPEKVSQSQNNEQNYLPPVDPRIPSTQYGFPEEDVSVQGLPVMEQRPVFQTSPVNGQQYVGPDFNSDIKSLDESYRQRQYQLQQEQYREFERQRQLEAAQARNRFNQQTPQVPRQYASPDATPSTTETTTKSDDITTETTTESDLNEGEIEDKDEKKQKVTVEVSKQKIQEYPGELFLSALAQLQLQPQIVPFGQIRAPLYFQPIQQETSQKQVASQGFDGATHFAALPSVLAQQQYQGFVNPAFQQIVVGQDQVGFVAQNPQAFGQYQPAAQVQNPQQFAQYQPVTQAQNPQFNTQYQPLPPQIPQSVAVQPQDSPKQDEEEDQQNDQEQPQFVYQQTYQPQEVVYQAPAPAPQLTAQYQPQGFQPQQGFQTQGVIYQAPSSQQAPASQYQPQEQQNVFLQAPQVQYQPQGQQTFVPQGQQTFLPQGQQTFLPQGQQTFLPQAQLVNYQPLTQQYQNGFAQQQLQFPNQQQAPQTASQPDALQSGLDVNQQGNGLEQNDDDERDDNSQDDGATSVAVATAFGTRTQPRMFIRYGAPAPLPRASANPQTTTEPAVEQVTESAGAVAEANAFAGRRKNARLRSRRVRPLFTLDRTGHLVLAQEQN